MNKLAIAGEEEFSLQRSTVLLAGFLFKTFDTRLSCAIQMSSF